MGRAHRRWIRRPLRAQPTSAGKVVRTAHNPSRHPRAPKSGHAARLGWGEATPAHYGSAGAVGVVRLVVVVVHRARGVYHFQEGGVLGSLGVPGIDAAMLGDLAVAGRGGGEERSGTVAQWRRNRASGPGEVSESDASACTLPPVRARRRTWPADAVSTETRRPAIETQQTAGHGWRRLTRPAACMSGRACEPARAGRGPPHRWHTCVLAAGKGGPTSLATTCTCVVQQIQHARACRRTPCAGLGRAHADPERYARRRGPRCALDGARLAAPRVLHLSHAHMAKCRFASQSLACDTHGRHGAHASAYRFGEGEVAGGHGGGGAGCCGSVVGS